MELLLNIFYSSPSPDAFNTRHENEEPHTEYYSILKIDKDSFREGFHIYNGDEEIDIKEGETLISGDGLEVTASNVQHYYTTAAELGADKAKIEQRIIDQYNANIQPFIDKAEIQFQNETFRYFIDNYNNLPKIFASKIMGLIQEYQRKNPEDFKIGKPRDFPIDGLEKLFRIKGMNIEKFKMDLWGEYYADSFYKKYMEDFNVQAAEWFEPLKKITDMVNNKKILINYGCSVRDSGRTNNVNYWVLNNNGQERTGSGGKSWSVVFPEELAISWKKGYTAAPHYFSVDKMPLHQLTDEQLQKVKEIQNSIEDRWKDLTGMSGKSSPPVGEGWFEFLKSPKADEQNDETAPPASADDFARLKEKFNKK